jgi:superfamily II DNA or RNA helicase
VHGLRAVIAVPSPLEAVLAGAQPLYEIPGDDLVGQVLQPAMAVSSTARVGAGFFSSHCLAQIAPGLAAFIESTSAPLELLISPEISSEDRDAIERGLRTPDEVVEEAMRTLFTDARLSSSAVVQHTLTCLSYLVAAQRLEVRFVLMREGMYHKKMWLFGDGDNWAAIHGSGNATARGLLVNGEQMTVDKPWSDGLASRRRVELLVEQWEKQWDNENPHSITLRAAQGLAFVGDSEDGSTVPTVRDFWAAWKADAEAGLEPELPPNYRAAPIHQLRIPPSVEWRSGAYGHQGRAVDALLDAQGRGVLQIATGGGKTRTALIAATQLQDQHSGPALVVIIVPSKPLMLQWADDVREFGIEPALPSLVAKDARGTMFAEIRAALGSSDRRTEVMVMTNSLFSTEPGVGQLAAVLPGDTLTVLVGDEMHNLGVPTFLADPPEQFQKRIGLSATPIRQYDPDGTDRLFDYFGQPVFEFSLGDAIAAGCLTPYRYELHEVHLTEDEMDKYADLTDELRAAGLRVDDNGQTVIPNSKVERLLRERRSVLENANGKIDVLRALLSKDPRAVRRTLIYTSAKPKVIGSGRQIEEVNALLAELGIISHQFTNAETSRADARRILDLFAAGDYQVLSAMRVLDEGIDIPQTDTAFVLASSTVTREWVQRRGRILRRAPGKTEATVHDFLVLPPDGSTNYGKSILRGELKRAEEFVGLASNEWVTGGPRSVISRYE